MEDFEILTVFKFRFTDDDCKGDFKDAVTISKAKIEDTLNRMGKVYCIGYQATVNTNGTVFCPIHSVKVDYAIEKKQKISAENQQAALKNAMVLVDKDGQVLKNDKRITGIRLRREIKKSLPELV